MKVELYERETGEKRIEIQLFKDHPVNSLSMDEASELYLRLMLLVAPPKRRRLEIVWP